MVVLEDGDVSLTPDNIETSTMAILSGGRRIIRWSVEDIKKGGFLHFMIRRFDQPDVFSTAIRASERTPPAHLQEIRQVVLVRGTPTMPQWSSATCREQAASCYGGVCLAFQYHPMRLVIGITQSGETADTLKALERACLHNCPTRHNNVMAADPRIADHTISCTPARRSALRQQNLYC